uniref:Uncharacterized protein n=1 Tax=Megaselia scalaris TaxID=36166 RepID=T1GWB7_MEGSC
MKRMFQRENKEATTNGQLERRPSKIRSMFKREATPQNGLERRPSKVLNVFKREKSPIPDVVVSSASVIDEPKLERKPSKVFSMFRKEKEVIAENESSAPTERRSRSPARGSFRGRAAAPEARMSADARLSPESANRKERSPSPMKIMMPTNIQIIPATPEIQMSSAPPTLERKPSKKFSMFKEKRLPEKSPEPNGTESKGFSLFHKEKSPVREKSTERKLSIFNREKSPVREKSMERKLSIFNREKSPVREKSAERKLSIFHREKSPDTERRPSATPGFFSNLFKSKKEDDVLAVQEVQMMGSMKPKKAPELMSVRVVETFSLKVDEMDQYNVQPKSQPSTPQRSGQASVNTSLEWSKKQLSHSSHISLTSSGKRLVSVSTGLSKDEGDEEIDMKSEVFSVHSMKSQSIDINDAFRPVVLNRRTQSQDRGGETEEDLISARMSKTVSFDFATSPGSQQNLSKSHRSRLSEQDIEQADWLERTYFSR